MQNVPRKHLVIILINMADYNSEAKSEVQKLSIGGSYFLSPWEALKADMEVLFSSEMYQSYRGGVQ